MGMLDGVPATGKDLLNMAGFPTKRGSRSTDTTPATEDAPAVVPEDVLLLREIRDSLKK